MASAERTLLLGLVLAAVPFLRGGLTGRASVGETQRQAVLRASVRRCLFELGGGYTAALPPAPAPLSNEGLARAFIAAALDAADDLGLARSDVVAAVNAHSRKPAAYRPERSTDD
ncbi:MAG: hypothetical protein F9K32_16655 [Desulfobulbaceae bacterium]|nr:MAG: hypothetical protein F9K32_16655 [Desulfobulbaceae bacterium]